MFSQSPVTSPCEALLYVGALVSLLVAPRPPPLLLVPPSLLLRCLKTGRDDMNDQTNELTIDRHTALR